MEFQIVKWNINIIIFRHGLLCTPLCTKWWVDKATADHINVTCEYKCSQLILVSSL